MFLIIFSIFIIHTRFLSLVWGQSVMLYSRKTTDVLLVEVPNCTNLDELWTDNLSAINTTGLCLRLYERKNCNVHGHSLEVIYSKGIDWEQEESWGFLIRSVGPCRDPCDPEILAYEPTDDEPWKAKLFNHAHPALYTISVNDRTCTAISQLLFKDIDLDMGQLNLSLVYINSTCVQLFDADDCLQEGIVIRQGSASHLHFPQWIVSRTKAVSSCAANCKNDSLIVLDKNESILFASKGYRGNSTNIRIDKCVNLRNVPLRWKNETSIGSVKALEKTCISLYKDFDCQGNSSSKLYGSTPKINLFGIGSIRACNFEIESNNTGTNIIMLLVVIVVPLMLAIGSCMLAIFLWRRCTGSPLKLSEKEIQEFRNGLGMELHNMDKECATEVIVQNEPFHADLEIERARINFDALVPIGSGQFGLVFKTVLQNAAGFDSTTGNDYENKDFLSGTPVALKTLRLGAPVEYLRSLMKEAKTMLYVGSHKNIVKLIGCVTTTLETEDKIWLLLEYCQNGSLESFLKTFAPFFTNYVVDGTLCAMSSGNNAYANVNFHTYQLVQWCIEIAEAMEYLAMKKVIHGDLAARNVLLTDKLQVKISDFGLSKQLYQYAEYVKKKAGPLPWRWMALESLKRLQFSTKSDVWSYAITCWEIFTLGNKPYTTYGFTTEFIKALENGLRPPMPANAPVECYNLMSRCWNSIALERPEFSNISLKIKNVLNLGSI